MSVFSKVLVTQVLRAIRTAEAPMTFDQIKDALSISDEDLQKVLDTLKARGKVESLEANEFKWSLVS